VLCPRFVLSTNQPIPDFTLKDGKAEDARVERSLYQRGVGYSYDAVKIFMPAGAKAPIYAPYVEHVPADVTACIFRLKNRDPAHWRDAWQVEPTLRKYIISDQPMSEELGGKAEMPDSRMLEDAARVLRMESIHLGTCSVS
jgi:hypothetical protein